ncbi:MAG: radical SAM protein, partial [Veillonella sp.]|nr:radical SAM protein [Veillonella sp.]
MNVVLSTLNSKFIHSSLALRYLKAYGEAHGQAYDIVEYTINMPVLHILSDITEHDIDVLGFACYIWNIEMTLHVVDMVKAVRPDIKIVLGGPEVSFTADELLERCPNIDYIVQGEGEEAFHDLVTALHLGNDGLDPVIPGVRGRRNGSILGSAEAVEVRDLSTIPFPYTEEDMDDLEHKIIYYESSRGCPFSCQYCLSGNKNTVRFFPQERTLEELQWFIDHGVKQVKFVDRTFNCAPHHHRPLMEFMRDSDTDMNFHLEMEP